MATLTRTIIHAICALAVLHVLAHTVATVSPAITFVLGLLMAGPIPGAACAMGISIGINRHRSLAIPAYACLLLIAGTVAVAGQLAAAFGLGLLGGLACRNVTIEQRSSYE